MTVNRLSDLLISKVKYRRIFYGIAVVLWMGVIFYFSSQNAVESSGSSSMVSRWILGILSNMGILSIADLTPQDFLRITGGIRTAAHFFEYLVFGAITFQFSRAMQTHPDKNRDAYSYPVETRFNPWGKSWFPIGICLFYALTDEIHQFYVPGRAMQLEDWLVDAAGVLCGTLLVTMILGRHRERLKKRNRNRSI